MYHLQITKSIHNTEKKFNNGRKIDVILDEDYESLDLINSTIKTKFNRNLEDLDHNGNEYFLETKEDINGEIDPKGELIANYFIRIENIN